MAGRIKYKNMLYIIFCINRFFFIENKFKNILHLNVLTFVFHYFYYSIASFCCFKVMRI